MSSQSDIPFFFEDFASDADSSRVSNIWNVWEDEITGFGETLPFRNQILKESSSSVTTLVDIIDDVIGRRKVWERLFGNSIMPTPAEGNVEKFYGILDKCFPSPALKGEEVLGLLKKAKE